MIKLLKNMKKYKGLVLLVLIFTISQVVAELFLPKLMADIVNIGIKNADTAYIIRTGWVMLWIAIAGTVAAVAKMYTSAVASMSFTRDLRERLFKKIQAFSPGEFDEIGTSSLITRTTNDITQIQNVVIMGLRMMIRAPMMAIGGIVMAVSKNPGLSSILLIAVIVLAVFIGIVASRTLPLFKSIQIKIDNLNRVVRERLTGVRVIRAFNRIEHEKERFDTANVDLTSTSLKVNRIMAAMLPMIMLLFNVTNMALIWFGAIRIDNGSFLVGDLMAFIQYAMQILFSIMMMTMIFIMIPRASASAIRINEIFDKESLILDPEHPVKAEGGSGVLEFKDVCFKYIGAEEYALSGISFKSYPGETTAIIGSTGSGKSTLVNMIPRFFDPCGGQILIDGTDIREMSQYDLRQKIGYVPQKAILFSGTIAENIRFGDASMDRARIEEAAIIAQSDEFILAMESEYESVVSQGGTNLSGGQKQRISIARAIASHKEIYIFDDSFSALDFKTDAKVRQALIEMIKDATVIIVSQRVNTIMKADRIIVLEKGEIVGMGTHRELMKNNHVYQDIVYSQMSEEESA
ncbi:MAG: ABC transporter ATP-binding protein [Tissierellales bacterium]|nr:ABC transporter ATP-binding protein [Tissierellales bacterium]MBN2826421.1 ABC transporter ATP-binding protein [Tissierellales bacterium]